MSKSTMVWDTYWADNQSANSFEFDYSTNEGPYSEVKSFWQGAFKQFSSNSIVVDIGSGNGALSNLYIQSTKDVLCREWLNIDVAATKELVRHSKIKYLNENIENLTLGDGGVDHFISMFGFEYADFSKSLPELKRCLSNTGSCDFILHHHNSIISQQSLITIKVYETLKRKELFSGITKLKSAPQIKQHLLSTLNKTLSTCKPAEQDDVKLFGQQIFNVLNQSRDLAHCLNLLQKLKQMLDMHIQRLYQQVNAAKQCKKFEKELKRHGFSNYRFEEMLYQNDILGWLFSYKH